MTVVHLLNSKLNLDLTADDIDAAHRLPIRDQTKPKPIIVRFMRREHKTAAMKGRSRLKGTGITIGEDLCKAMLEVTNRARNHPRVKDTWAWNGSVYIKDFGDKVYKLNYGEPLDGFNLPPNPEPMPVPSGAPHN